MIFTVGSIDIPDRETGKRMGVVDISKGDDGDVWLRVNRYGSEVIIRMPSEIGAEVGKLINAASGPFKDGCSV